MRKIIKRNFKRYFIYRNFVLGWKSIFPKLKGFKCRKGDLLYIRLIIKRIEIKAQVIYGFCESDLVKPESKEIKSLVESSRWKWTAKNICESQGLLNCQKNALPAANTSFIIFLTKWISQKRISLAVHNK